MIRSTAVTATLAPRRTGALRFRLLPGWGAALVLAAGLLLAGCDRTETVQRGYRGTSMFQLKKPSEMAALADINKIPEPEAQDAPDPEAPAIKEVFQNVKVLNDLTVLEFSRLMQALSTWVAPDEGCEFCHNPDNLASDEKYTKVVARRMLQMTRSINTTWKPHVGSTGVTCWTCHRGQAVPSGDWFANPGLPANAKMMGFKDSQNSAGQKVNGNTALPNDALSAFLDHGAEVRIQGTTALAQVKHDSIKKAEWSYSLMIYMSNSLGVNCTYCHNTRAMGRWEQSTPQRVTAWHGIRMVRQLNNDYLNVLKPLFPANRLSPQGDGPKVGCETCHKGAYKPMYGVSMLTDYPELAGEMVRAPAAAGSAPVAAAPAAAPAVAAAKPADSVKTAKR